MPAEIYTLRLGINRCYIIKDKGTIMIDGGPPNKIRHIQKFLNKHSLNPKDIKLIVLTHGDFDHIGSVKDLKELTGAEIAIHKSDRSHLENSIYNFPPGVTGWGRFLHFVLDAPLKQFFKIPSTQADIELNEKEFLLDQYGIDGKIIYTPGHTFGSVSVLLKTGEAFVGCLAHNNVPFRLHPNLPIFGEDIEKIKESWKTIINHGVKIIYPGHGNPFPIDLIKKILIEDKK